LLTSEVFGRELRVEELVKILAGLWAQLADNDSWQLRLDDQGHVLGGERDGLQFVLKEIFLPVWSQKRCTSLPRITRSE